MNVIAIPLDRVDVGDRLRAIDPDYVALLAAAMKADGQRTPIEVRAPSPAGKYPLVSGAHRIAAAREAGKPDIFAVVQTVDDLTAQRLEIEENLVRHDLTELDRSVFLARWKELYEALNPETRHGGKRKRGESRQIGDINDVLFGSKAPGAEPPRFTALAAAKFGSSDRSISRAVYRYLRIAPDVRARISGTWLADHGAELDNLARMRPEVQRKVVTLAQERGATALRHLRDEVMGIRAPAVDVDQQQFDTLMKLWRKTGALARKRFLSEMDQDAQFNLAGDAS